MKIFVLLSIIFFCSSLFAEKTVSVQKSENKYVIQVGAFRDVPEKMVTDIMSYGTVQQEKSGDLIRLSVGKFHSRKDAEVLLVDIKKQYPDAFVRQIPEGEGIKSKHNHVVNHAEEHEHPHFDKKEMEKWQQLTEDQKAHAVYLDGELHLKYGDKFTRVE